MFGSALAHTGTPVTTTSSGSSFGTTLGNIFNRALDTAATFGSGLLGIELLERANNAGVTSNTSTSQSGSATTGTDVNSGSAQQTSGGLFSGLPSWAGPAAIGGSILLVILLVFALMRKG